MAVHVTVREALDRARAALGKIGLPQAWAPFGTRSKSAATGTVNDCCFFFTYLLKDNGGRVRSDYRNGSIKALRADRNWPESQTGRPGDGVLLRWSGSGLPDHIGIVEEIHDDGSVTTIEGNSGPSVGVFTPCGVHRRRRYPANIVGFIRPPYLTK